MTIEILNWLADKGGGNDGPAHKVGMAEIKSRIQNRDLDSTAAEVADITPGGHQAPGGAKHRSSSFALLPSSFFSIVFICQVFGDHLGSSGKTAKIIGIVGENKIFRLYRGDAAAVGLGREQASHFDLTKGGATDQSRIDFREIEGATVRQGFHFYVLIGEISRIGSINTAGTQLLETG